MHSPIRVVGFLFAWALGVVMVVFDGFEMSCALVFFAERVIQAHLEGPGVYLFGIGHDVLDDKGAERGPEIVGLPRADTQTVSPVGGVWGIDHQAIQTGDGFLPSFRHNKRIGSREHMPQLRFGEAYVQAPQKGQELG